MKILSGSEWNELLKRMAYCEQAISAMREREISAAMAKPLEPVISYYSGGSFSESKATHGSVLLLILEHLGLDLERVWPSQQTVRLIKRDKDAK